MSNDYSILCLLACMAWIVGLTWMVLWPIERDRTLSQGRARNLLVIIAIILSLPLVLSFLIQKSSVQPEELVYDDGLYQKWQPYAFQQEVDSNTYARIGKDTALVYSPKSYRRQQIEQGHYHDPSLVWAVYYQFLTPSRLDMAATTRGRRLDFALSMLGIVLLTGLLVSLISNFFQRRIDRWQQGQLRYRYGLGRFCVIIGANEMLASTIRELDERYGRRLQHILVLTPRNIPALRRSLLSELSAPLERKVVLYNGMQGELDEIRQLRCQEAEEVFILGDIHLRRSEHDTLNILTLKHISSTLKQCDHRLRVHVLLTDDSTYSVFQLSDLSEKDRKKLEFIPFNMQETWARKVLVENHATGVNYEPLDTREGISLDSQKYVHLVVDGLSDMGVALAEETAHIAHYPNYSRDQRLKTRITFVDRQIDHKAWEFKAQFRELFSLYQHLPQHLVVPGEDPNFLDIEWEFLEGSLRDMDFLHQHLDEWMNPDCLLTLALCQEDSDRVLSTALSLPRQLYEKSVQVLAYQPLTHEIVQVLSQSHKQFFQKLRPFGMLADCVDPSNKVMPLSKMLNYAYNYPEDPEMKHAMQDADGSFHDHVSECWARQTTANQWSNVYNSDSIPTKLRSLGIQITPDTPITLTAEDIDQIAEVEHRRWTMEKLLMGFRPLTEEEQRLCLADPAEKKRLKAEQMAHLDICSFERLKQVDYPSIEYDKTVTTVIPTMIREHFTPLPDVWKR